MSNFNLNNFLLNLREISNDFELVNQKDSTFFFESIEGFNLIISFPNDKTIELNNIFINKDLRDSEKGSLIVNLLFSEGKKSGFKQIIAISVKENAKNFFKKLGFIEILGMDNMIKEF